MNEAMESVIVSETLNDSNGTPVPARVPGAFVVNLLEDTGRFDRGEAELLLSIFEWVEMEARGFPDLLEGLCRLRGAGGEAKEGSGGLDAYDDQGDEEMNEAVQNVCVRRGDAAPRPNTRAASLLGK